MSTLLGPPPSLPTAQEPPAQESPVTQIGRAKGSLAFVSLVTAAATVLRFHALTAKSFWFDEGLSVGLSRMPLPELFRSLQSELGTMPLYNLLLHFWMIASHSDFFVRTFSVLFSIATVPILYAIGVRLFNRGTGVLAGWLLAISAFHIRYAQEARSYALVVFFVALATWLLVRNVQSPASSCWWGYVAACVLAVYSHPFAILVIGAHILSLACLPRSRVAWRSVGLSLICFFLLTLPMTIFALKMGTGPVSWVPQMSLDNFVDFWTVFAGNDGKLLLILDVLAVASFALGAAKACAAKAWRVPASSPELPGNRWSYAVVFLWLFVPMILVAAISQMHPVFVLRYLMICLPALMLAVAAGIMRLRPDILRWALCAGISLCALLGTNNYYRADFDLQRDDWRWAASYVLDRARPGDGIFFYSQYGQMVFNFYRLQRNPVPAAPQALNSPNGWDFTSADILSGILPRNARPAGDRVWMVMLLLPDLSREYFDEVARIRSSFSEGRRLIDVERAPPLAILLFDRDTVSSKPSDKPNNAGPARR